MTVYVPEDLKRRLGELAQRRGTSQAALIPLNREGRTPGP
ncbi:MAG TPA: CopG family transcriptional regulator [Actinomycetota bacterium]|nr:CopG family transcriptional regulator [Actinomycetota bacterium]